MAEEGQLSEMFTYWDVEMLIWRQGRIKGPREQSWEEYKTTKADNGDDIYHFDDDERSFISEEGEWGGPLDLDGSIHLICGMSVSLAYCFHVSIVVWP